MNRKSLAVLLALTPTSLLAAEVAARSVTFSEYIFSGVFSPYIVLAAAFGSATVGMVTHWYKKVIRDGSIATFKEWFFTNNFRNTVMALIGVWVSTWAAIAPIAITDMSLWGAITLGFPIGYAADSALNKVDESQILQMRAKRPTK